MGIQISFTRELTVAAISGAAEYFEIFESQMGPAKAAEKTRIREMLKGLKLTPDEERTEWDVAMQEHEATFDMLLPNYFRYSFIALLSLIAESKLREVSYAAMDVRKISVAPPRPKQRITQAFRKYIVTEAGISNLNWDALSELGKVRNCIVHRSGRVKGHTDESFLIQLSRKREGLHISDSSWDYQRDLQPLFLEDHMLMIEPEYCRYTVGAVKAFFEDFCDKIPLPKFVIAKET